MNLIEKLGLEKCQAIVDGAPNLTVVTISTYCADTKNYWDGNGQPCESCIDLSDLRTAIAEHKPKMHSHLTFGRLQGDDIDHCTDIRNHISPLTEVTER